MPAAVRVRAYLKRGKGVPPATGELRVDASSAVEWTAADGDERPRSVPADDVVRVLTKGEKPMIKVRRACVMCRRLWRKSNRRGFCCARVQHRRGSTSGQAQLGIVVAAWYIFQGFCFAYEMPLASNSLLAPACACAQLEVAEGKGPSLIFTFDGVGARDGASRAITSLIDHRRALRGEMPRSRRSNAAEVALRKAVLMKDANLRKLHAALVLGEGIVSDDDFWAERSRQSVLEAEAARDPSASAAAARQPRGAASAMLARDAFGAMTGGSQRGSAGGTVRYKITPEVKAQIFRERPAVRRAYVAVVPSKMAEKDFWEKFCRAEYFARRAATVGKTAADVAAAEAAAAGPSDDPGDAEADVALFTVNEEERSAEKARAAARVSRAPAARDLSTDAGDALPSAFGTARGGLMEPSATIAAAARAAAGRDDAFADAAAGGIGGVASQINRHGDVVMRGHEGALDGLVNKTDTAAIARAIDAEEAAEPLPAEVEQEQRGADPLVGAEAVVIDDLVTTAKPAVDLLTFENPFKRRKLHEVGDGTEGGNGSVAAAVVVAIDGAGAMRKALERLRGKGARASAEEPAAAWRVLDALGQSLQRGLTNVPPLQRLPAELRESVSSRIEVVRELMRNFWALYAPGKPPSGVDKARGDKFEAKMRELSDAIAAERREAPVESRVDVAAAYRNASAMLDAGFERYDRCPAS